MKIIIIGGVAGGATTAARIRRSDETAEIIFWKKESTYLTYGSAVRPKDILLSPYRLWSDTGMLDIKTWGCCV